MSPVVYLSYEEYVAMGGTLTEAQFTDYEFQAEAVINYATFNRLKKNSTIPEVVKRLVKYIVDIVHKKSDSMSLGNTAESGLLGGVYLTSQSNDGVSASYNGMSSTDLFNLCDGEIQQSIQLYLNGVLNELGQNLLYRGLYPGE